MTIQNIIQDEESEFFDEEYRPCFHTVHQSLPESMVTQTEDMGRLRRARDYTPQIAQGMGKLGETSLVGYEQIKSTQTFPVETYTPRDACDSSSHANSDRAMCNSNHEERTLLTYEEEVLRWYNGK